LVEKKGGDLVFRREQKFTSLSERLVVFFVWGRELEFEFLWQVWWVGWVWWRGAVFERSGDFVVSKKVPAR
jgi:hypothetical protein